LPNGFEFAPLNRKLSKAARVILQLVNERHKQTLVDVVGNTWLV